MQDPHLNIFPFRPRPDLKRKKTEDAVYTAASTLTTQDPQGIKSGNSSCRPTFAFALMFFQFHFQWFKISATIISSGKWMLKPYCISQIFCMLKCLWQVSFRTLLYGLHKTAHPQFTDLDAALDQIKGDNCSVGQPAAEETTKCTVCIVLGRAKLTAVFL